MFPRLTLTKKVLLLVAVPLALELGFIGILFGVMAQVDQERRQAEHARDLTSALNTFLRMTMEAILNSVMFYFSHEDKVFERSAAVSGRLKDQVHRIKLIVVDYPAELAVINHVEEVVKNSEKEISSARQDMAADNRDAAFDKWSEFKTNFRDLNEQVQHLVDEQLDVERKKTAAAEYYRQRVSMLLWIGIGVNITAAVGLAIAFNRSLVSRLIILSDNTMRLSAGKPLHPPLQGTDEIAHLDDFLRKMAQSLAEARQKEKQIEQLKQDFVAMVSHDLRTPLTAIQLLHSSFSEGVYGEISQRGQENLGIVETEVDRLIRMVNDLLSMEKLESGSLFLESGNVDLNAFLNRSAASVKRIAESKNVSLQVCGVEGPVQVMMDEERVLQVMINLLGNAIKFAEPGTGIEIAAAVKAPNIEIAVSDRNAQIPEELRDSIFERFKQVSADDSRDNKGVGLGLAICKAIVERHGGTIGLRPRDGGGNTFWFSLPAVVTE